MQGRWRKKLDEIRAKVERLGYDRERGVFVACTFSLVECRVRERRPAEAEAAFERAVGQANELGLFTEEYDPEEELMLGNDPQALSHCYSILALITLAGNGAVRA